MKRQRLRSGDDISFSFMARTGENPGGDGVNITDIHRALRRVLERQIKFPPALMLAADERMFW